MRRTKSAWGSRAITGSWNVCIVMYSDILCHTLYNRVKNELEKGRRLTSAPMLHYYLKPLPCATGCLCIGFSEFLLFFFFVVFRSSSGLGLNPCNGSVGDVIRLCYKISDPTVWKSPIRSDLIFRKSPIRRLGNLRSRSFGSLRSDPIFSEISDLRNLPSSHFVLDD